MYVFTVMNVFLFRRLADILKFKIFNCLLLKKNLYQYQFSNKLLTVTLLLKDESSSVAVGVTVSVDENDQEEGKPEPTHYSKLDLKKMRVDELRAELEARNLDTKGLKQQLIVRLREALEDEQVIFC